MGIESALHWGREWQSERGPALAHHTVTRESAARLALAYVGILRRALSSQDFSGLQGLGIGSGAGHLEEAIHRLGLPMTVSEWNDDGLALLASEVPALPRRLIDISTFDDREGWDVILCRELYPFTRVSDYPAQMDLIRRMLMALRRGGVLLLIGSDASVLDHLDYSTMCRDLRRDGFDVLTPVLEPVIKRFPRSGIASAMLNPMIECALSLANQFSRKRVVGIRVYTICKPMA